MGDIALPLGLAIALIALVVVLVLVIWSVKRHGDPRLNVECEQGLHELLPSLAGLCHGSLLGGNQVEILENNAWFDALFEGIAGAKKSIHFETFLWKEGELGGKLSKALAARARDGLEVRVLLDANGCKDIGKQECRTMEEAGCRIKRYHEKKLRNLGVLNRRDHRKIAVFDGRMALVGGHCIVDHWYKDCEGKLQFHDIGVRVRGPAVHPIQSAFGENWVDESGELFVGDDVWPELEPVGDVKVHVARVKPERAAPAVKILHHLVLCIARERLWITNPYFLPDTEAIEAMEKACKRGVDIRVMVPAIDASDMPMVQHAAHRNFGQLLKAGVRIFEYPSTLIHQKVMTVDGQWCAVGSSNFDERSFEINDEITLGLQSSALATQFEQIFERDTRDCVELKLEAWKHRGFKHKLKDHAAYLLKEQL